MDSEGTNLRAREDHDHTELGSEGQQFPGAEHSRKNAQHKPRFGGRREHQMQPEHRESGKHGWFGRRL